MPQLNFGHNFSRRLLSNAALDSSWIPGLSLGTIEDFIERKVNNVNSSHGSRAESDSNIFAVGRLGTNNDPLDPVNEFERSVIAIL